MFKILSFLLFSMFVILSQAQSVSPESKDPVNVKNEKLRKKIIAAIEENNGVANDILLQLRANYSDVQQIVKKINNFYIVMRYVESLEQIQMKYDFLHALWDLEKTNDDVSRLHQIHVDFNYYLIRNNKIDAELKAKTIELIKIEIRPKIIRASANALKAAILSENFNKSHIKEIVGTIRATTQDIFDDANRLAIDEVYNQIPLDQLFERIFEYTFPTDIDAICYTVLKNESILLNDIRAASISDHVNFNLDENDRYELSEVLKKNLNLLVDAMPEKFRYKFYSRQVYIRNDRYQEYLTLPIKHNYGPGYQVFDPISCDAKVVVHFKQESNDNFTIGWGIHRIVRSNFYDGTNERKLVSEIMYSNKNAEWRIEWQANLLVYIINAEYNEYLCVSHDKTSTGCRMVYMAPKREKYNECLWKIEI